MAAKTANGLVIRDENLHSRTGDRLCWVVAGATFWINFCLLGVLRSSAVVFVALVDVFQVNREDAAWPSGIFGFFMCITGVLSGYLSHYLSIKCILMVGALVASMSVSLCSLATRIEHVTVFYGALQGAGIGVIVPLTHVILNRNFSRYRAVAMGIAYAGSSAGSFCFPPLAHWMLTIYGLDGTFLLLGGIMLHSVLGVSLIRTSNGRKCLPRDLNQDPETLATRSTLNGKYVVSKNTETNESSTSDFVDSKEKLKRKTLEDNVTQQWKECSESDAVRKLKSICIMTTDILKNVDFLLLSATFAIYFSASAIFLMVIIDFADEKSIPSERGVFLVSAFSFGDFAGRLGCGWIGDMNCVDRKTVVCCYLMSMGVLLISAPLCSTYELMLTLSVALGLLNGSVIVNYSPLLTECLGLHRLALVVGFSSSIIGVTAFLRPIVIGYFRDQNESYDFLFVSLGVLQIFLILIWLLRSSIPKLRKFLSFE